MKYFLWLLVGLPMLSGCATILNDDLQRITIYSDIRGTEVGVYGKVYLLPVEVQIPRNDGNQIFTFKAPDGRVEWIYMLQAGNKEAQLSGSMGPFAIFTFPLDVFTDRTQGLTPDRGDGRLWVAVDELHYRFNPKPVVEISSAEQR